ncbi:nickel-dependent hydrogenase large subunit [Propionivibrio sp.]|uniref:nickel-dependent hydrogenase large subunit n=1 Tax=Propionivibrio sp. TaxID=2212460 RepID=UPI003BF35FCF
MSTGIDAGSVQIRVQGDGVKVIDAQFVSQRPQVARVLKGRQADAAATLLPLLFSLCARAQGAAARLAVAAARGEESAPRLDPDIVREVMREHLWRWLLDLPALFGMAALRDQFLMAVRALEAGHGEALQKLLAAPEIIRLIESIRALDQPVLQASVLLQMNSAQASLEEWPQLGEALCRTPTWRGQAAETGAYARRTGDTAPICGAFASRWLARLAELETWALSAQQPGAAGTASAVPVAPGIGRALVETARGLLMHEVVLEDDRVAEYSIVAPTEWNFHPLGPLSGWLIGKPCADEATLRGFVAHAVAALDPCVSWELALEPVQPPS